MASDALADFRSRRHFIPHPDAERFDTVTVDTVERWKESELSGDEWRFSYVARFWRHGICAASGGGSSIEDALVQAAANYSRTKTTDDGGYYGNLAEVCCQPGCPKPWTVLMHPVRRYSSRGEELTRPYGEGDVRGFCERHRHRGDCGLDDNDDNYVEVETRFPPDWEDDDG